MADPISLVAAQLAQYIDPSSSGGAWSTQSGRRSGAGFGPEGFLKKMAENFINQTGLTDLSKLGYGKINTPENAPVVREPIYGGYEYDYASGTYYPVVTGYKWVTPTADFQTDENGFLVAGGYRGLTPQEIKTIKDVGNGRYTADVVVGREGYYNKDTGKAVNFNGTLGGYGEGPGWTNTRLTFKGNRPVITTTGEDSSDLGTILPIISIALLAIPGIGQAIGSAILPTGVSAATATAVGNAVVNAGLQVAAGAPVEQALTNATASLGVSQLVPNLSGNSFVDNAVRSVATATLTGGDVEKALANSLIATGGNEVLGNVSFTGNATVDSGIASAITSGVMAAATGGDVGESIARGFAAGTSGQITKEERAAESARSGAGFVGEEEPQAVAQTPAIDPRIVAQGVTGGQFGEGEFLQTGGNIGVNVLPPNPQSEFGVQKNINARADFNESSLGAKYGEINSPHYGKLISSIIINDVVDANGNPIDTPVGYYAIYDPDTKSTFYEFSLSDGTTVTSKTRPFVEQGKIFSEDKFYELKPSRQPTELNIDIGAGNGAFLGGTEDLVEEPVAGITISASKPTIDQRLLDLVEQAPDQESATNATVAYYQALDNDLSDDEALNAAKTAMQAKSPEILFEDSVVDQQPTEQQVADTGITVVGQPQLSQIDQDVLEQIQRDQGLVSEPPQITAQTPMPVAQDVTQVVNDGGEEQVYIPPPATRTTTPTVTPTLPEPIFRSAVAPRPALDLTDPSSEYFGERTYGDVTPPALPAPVVDSAQAPVGESVVVVAVDPVNNEALVIDASGNTSVVSATDSATGNPVNTGEAVTLTPDNSLTTGQATVAGGTATDVVSGTPVDTAPVVTAPVDTGVTDAGAVDTTQVATGGEAPSTGTEVVDTTGGGLPSTDVGGVVGGEPGGAVDVGEVGGQTGGDIGGLSGGDLGGDLGGIDLGLPTDTSGVGDTGGEVVEEPSVLPPEEIYDFGDITDDEILQLITDDLVGGVEADRGVEEEGDGGLPTEDTQLTVTPRVVSTPPVRVPAGQRVQDTSDILPTRVALSEGSGDDVYGTPEEEQDPVWNIRSLKLRRALRI